MADLCSEIESRLAALETPQPKVIKSEFLDGYDAAMELVRYVLDGKGQDTLPIKQLESEFERDCALRTYLKTKLPQTQDTGKREWLPLPNGYIGCSILMEALSK
jgi:hypothetical protein